MPGLLGADVTFYNQGTLRKATIQIVAYNIEQLELIDLLYMKVGYNIMLEYGHTSKQYSDNIGKP